MSYELTRKELYEKVWSEPLRTLAPTFSISDVALGKICRKAAIPLPGTGYWAKKNAGKPTITTTLPPRFPGALNTVCIAGNSYSGVEIDLLNDPIPPLPEFDEELESVKKRVTKMVGKVPFPKTTTKTHPIIKKLLKQDEESEKELETRGYAWPEPRFNSPIQKRRLRMLNAIFLATESLGCKPNMSTSKYAEDSRDITIRVGDQHVRITQQYINPNKRRSRSRTKEQQPFCFSILDSYSRDRCRQTWEDSGDIPVEKSLDGIVVEIIMMGEIQYRESIKRRHKWMVERKAELIEEDRQRKIEEKRKAKEFQEKQERERIKRLLNEATSHQHAETIRKYVETVHTKIDKINAPREAIDEWATWALAQADKIDPLENLSFLNIGETSVSDDSD